MEIPANHTGIIEWGNGERHWFKNGKRHREDGPAIVYDDVYKQWWLDGYKVWESGYGKLDLRDKIILSKDPHPKYSTIQVLTYLDKNGIQEQAIIPEMEY